MPAIDAPERQAALVPEWDKEEPAWLKKPVPKTEIKYQPTAEEIEQSRVWRSFRPNYELSILRRELEQAKAVKKADLEAGRGTAGLEKEIASYERAIAIAEQVAPERQNELNADKQSRQERRRQKKESRNPFKTPKAEPKLTEQQKLSIQYGLAEADEASELKQNQAERDRLKSEFFRQADKFVNTVNIPKVKEIVDESAEDYFENRPNRPFHEFTGSIGGYLRAEGEMTAAASCYEYAFKEAEEVFILEDNPRSYESLYAEEWIDTVSQMYFEAYHNFENELLIEQGIHLNALAAEEQDTKVYGSTEMEGFFEWFETKRNLLGMMEDSLNDELIRHQNRQQVVDDELAHLEHLLGYTNLSVEARERQQQKFDRALQIFRQENDSVDFFRKKLAKSYELRKFRHNYMLANAMEPEEQVNEPYVLVAPDSSRWVSNLEKNYLTKHGQENLHALRQEREARQKAENDELMRQHIESVSNITGVPLRPISSEKPTDEAEIEPIFHQDEIVVPHRQRIKNWFSRIKLKPRDKNQNTQPEFEESLNDLFKKADARKLAQAAVADSTRAAQSSGQVFYDDENTPTYLRKRTPKLSPIFEEDPEAVAQKPPQKPVKQNNLRSQRESIIDGGMSPEKARWWVVKKGQKEQYVPSTSSSDQTEGDQASPGASGSDSDRAEGVQMERASGDDSRL